MSQNDLSQYVVLGLIFGLPVIYAIWMGTIHRKEPKSQNGSGVTDKHRG